MSNTAILKSNVYAENAKREEKKSLLKRMQVYFQENSEMIISGILLMSGNTNGYRILNKQ